MDVVALQDRIRIKSHSPPLDFRRAGGMTLELVFARRCQEQGGFVRSLASMWVVGAETKGDLGTSLHHTLLNLLNTGITHLPIVFH